MAKPRYSSSMLKEGEQCQGSEGGTSGVLSLLLLLGFGVNHFHQQLWVLLTFPLLLAAGSWFLYGFGALL